MADTEFSVRLGLKNAEFIAGLKSSKDQLAAFQDTIEKNEKRWTMFRNAATAGALVIGAAFRGIVERADEIKDLSDRFGVGTEALQKVGLVAEKSGSSLEAVAKAMNKLAIEQDKALGGDKGAQEAFAQLGVSIDDLRNLSPDQIMTKIGQGAMNAAPLVAVLGKGALELRDTLQQLKDAAPEGIIADEDVQRLAQLKDDALELWRALEAAGAAVAGPIVGGLKDALDGFQGLAAGVGGLFSGRGFLKSMREDVHAKDLARIRAGLPGKKAAEDVVGEQFGPQKSDLDDYLKKMASGPEQFGPTRRDLQNHLDEEANKKLDRDKKESEAAREQKLQNEKEMNRAEADKASRDRDIHEKFLAAKDDARLDTLQTQRDKIRDRMGMTGTELAQSKRDERRQERLTERADRRFARKYGDEALKELKDREDPVKQAEAAYKKAMEASEKELGNITTELVQVNTTLDSKLVAPSNE